MISIFLLFFAGCITFISVGQSSPQSQDYTVVNLIIGGILTVYEIVVRVVPSAKDYSILSFGINLLRKISNSMNNIKKPPE